ncbi:activator-dependent family glycosyltransferase [Nocardiopsis tropica]|uniref:Activator-dependent family glycosyltransferase n=1 Tax=Nocardiopsis tropica TaxID=109330 RepID=A0ABU7KU35_9ACTN|nr:activator-dependent family glycosyltransferase [Nocardiopsis umidischolae]MEE2052803.1 activator-dependent family glycosyltransferase [Nocardiopsis umidischolae]
MRVLVVSQAEKTHMLGLIPQAWALRAAGHEVRVASQPALLRAVSRTGLPAVPVGRDHLFHQLLTTMRGLGFGDTGGFDMARSDPEAQGLDYLLDGYRQFVRLWWHPVNAPMLDDLADFCRWWRPDLVLWEPTTFAAPVAARASGAAHARVLWGMDVFSRTRRRFLGRLAELPAGDREDPLAEWLESSAARVGTDFSEELVSGQATLDPYPAGLRLAPEAGIRHLPLRYVPYNGPAVVPDWLRAPGRRRRVCLTLGSGPSERFDDRYRLPLGELLESIAELDVEVVATLSADQSAGLGRVPGNVRVVEHVPLHALMPRCSAVVHHGGAGTFCTAVFHGVPQLILPEFAMAQYAFDEPLLAAHVTELEGGLTLEGAHLTGKEVTRQVGRLLDEPRFAEGARRLSERAREMPSPADLVPVLEGLAAEHRRV